MVVALRAEPEAVPAAQTQAVVVAVAITARAAALVL
jgi:hypothetical protein